MSKHWPEFEIVVARSAQTVLGYGVIGHNGDTPWHMPADLNRFRLITTANRRNAVIMGRKTWDTIPSKYRPLPDRLNIIVTRQKLDPHSLEMGREGEVRIVHSLDEAFEAAGPTADHLGYYPFVIGGGEIYAQTINSPKLVRVHQTIVTLGLAGEDRRQHPVLTESDLNTLTFFPEGPRKGLWHVTQTEEGLDKGMRYRYEVLTRKRKKKKAD